MNAMWSEARAKVGHRLAMHLHVDLFRLRTSTPMLSFTFDDLPKSAVTTGAAMLEAHGARGTFYVSGSLVGADAPDWVTGDGEDVVSLHHGGHEIGCHTFSHQRACDLDEGAMRQEILRNRAYLHALDPSIRIDSFAYPFGYGSYARKHQLKKEFETCRSIVQGVNSGGVDLQFLRAMPLIDREMDRDGIERAFDDAQTNNGWLIFYGHDVTNRPSPYGCSPALLEHALAAASRRKIPILTVAEAMRCARG
ncbi:polysaccharide deacetylase family protein [Bradyrhizobium sp. sBnM-33]|uniref:polysaccharide deacetylase family protein n=1 Tax=Bradyrhizobium sp. sBnM-33 TaxID=2831780 RepID=UPI0020BFD45B|nr:polysaccharide deacetylase family protein [Bradyrhizobium sp. sBnM-33]WOH49860.1 polysaccharide deacetylase family protein [Bradyrhizobium sp. sBnM-33]